MSSELEGYTFDYGGNVQNCMYQYIRSIKKIAEYVGEAYEYGGDIRWTIENLEIYNIIKPSTPDEYEVKKCVKRTLCLKRNLKKVYHLILWQCSPPLKTRVEKEKDVIGLIKAIKEVVFHSEYHYYPLVLCNAIGNFYRFEQGPKMSNRAFKEKFMNLVAVIDELGGDLVGELGVHPGLIEKELKLMDSNLSLKSASIEQLEEAKEVSKEKFLACVLLSQADENRYEKLLRDLHNGYLLRKDFYPKTVAKAYELLLNSK